MYKSEAEMIAIEAFRILMNNRDKLSVAYEFIAGKLDLIDGTLEMARKKIGD